MSRCTFVVGDTRAVVASLPDDSVDLLITSPPFLALRSYLPADHPDKALEIGSEATPAAFIDTLLALTAEWRRVLAPHGTLALELGDTYSGSGGAGGDYAFEGLRAGQPVFSARQNGAHARTNHVGGNGWPLAKCAAMIPELYRVALAYGLNPLTGQESPAGRWRVRNTVTWARPNPPVGALGDKFRPSTSDLVIACTASDRWFDLDAVRTEPKPHSTKYGDADTRARHNDGYVVESRGDGGRMTFGLNPAGAPPLDHWVIPPGGFRGSHYAVWPPELIWRPIEACCPRRVCRTCGKPSRRETVTTNAIAAVGPRHDELQRRANTADTNAWKSATGDTTSQTTTIGWSSCGCPDTDGIRLDGWHTGTGWRAGVVLDPFGGSGTTGVVATGRGRDAILVDLDSRNAELARERLGMFLDVEHFAAEVPA